MSHSWRQSGTATNSGNRTVVSTRLPCAALQQAKNDNARQCAPAAVTACRLTWVQPPALLLMYPSSHVLQLHPSVFFAAQPALETEHCNVGVRIGIIKPVCKSCTQQCESLLRPRCCRQEGLVACHATPEAYQACALIGGSKKLLASGATAVAR